MSVLNDILNNNTNPKGCYCFVCGSQEVKKVVTTNGEEFVCKHQHQSPRIYLFDGRAIQHIEQGELVHETAGAVIKRKLDDNTLYLLFLRRKFPFQYTIPAGHLEYDESPIECVKREVLEETGLNTVSINPTPGKPLRLTDPCRRGADVHYWHLFTVETTGEPRLSDEGRIIGWYTLDEIMQLKTQELLTEPVRKIFNELFYK